MAGTRGYSAAYNLEAFDGTDNPLTLPEGNVARTEEEIILDAMALARELLRDYPRSYGDEFTAKGYPVVYRLSMGRVIPSSFEVWVEDPTANTVVQNTADWQLEPLQGYLRISAAIPGGNLLHVLYTAYEWVSDDSLRAYSGITFEQYKKFFGDRWPDAFASDERYKDLLAMATVVETCWALLTEAARDVDVLSPEENIPVSQRYRMLEGLLAAWTGRLRDLEALMDIGVYTMSINWFRRISRLTGKLVPIYMSQEYDDVSYPSRIFTRIDRPSDEVADPDYYDREAVEAGGYNPGSASTFATPSLPAQGA